MISDAIEFSIVKLFLLIIIKHAGENTFSAIQMNTFLSNVCLLILKNPSVDLFYIKHCYIVSLPGRDSYYHPFQEFYFLSKQMKFGEGFCFGLVFWFFFFFFGYMWDWTQGGMQSERPCITSTHFMVPGQHLPLLSDYRGWLCGQQARG